MWLPQFRAAIVSEDVWPCQWRNLGWLVLGLVLACRSSDQARPNHGSRITEDMMTLETDNSVVVILRDRVV